MRKNNRMHRLSKKVLLTSLLAHFALIPASANAAVLNATAGGTVTFNYDSKALGQYVYGSENNPGFYLANFWNTAASNPYEKKSSYFAANIGTTQIPATHLVHDITAVGSYSDAQESGRHVQATSANFSLDSDTLTGVTGEQIGMTGVQGYYLPTYPAPYNYMMAGDFSLGYDPAARANAWGAQVQVGTSTGWFIKNNLGFGLVTYDLTDLSLVFADANNWKLSGNLLMAPGYANMLAGPSFLNVGNFEVAIGSYAVSNVPLPATAWVFLTGLASLLFGGRRKAMSA